jgi:hypothetical protein
MTETKPIYSLPNATEPARPPVVPPGVKALEAAGYQVLGWVTVRVTLVRQVPTKRRRIKKRLSMRMRQES